MLMLAIMNWLRRWCSNVFSSTHLKTRLKTIRSQHTSVLLLLLFGFFSSLVFFDLLPQSPSLTPCSLLVLTILCTGFACSRSFMALLFWFSGFCGIFFLACHSFSSIRCELTYFCYFSHFVLSFSISFFHRSLFYYLKISFQVQRIIFNRRTFDYGFDAIRELRSKKSSRCHVKSKY